MTSLLRCPQCGGAQFAVLHPGSLRCLTERVVNVVPSGQGGNFGPAPVPIYGPCGNVATEEQWQAAGQQLQAQAAAAARAAEAAKVQAEQQRKQSEDLAQRLERALTDLAKQGNPRLVARRVPGRYYLSPFNRFFGRVGEVQPVEVEGAWPIGTFTWHSTGSHGVDIFKDLPTGYTPSQRFVPMQEASAADEEVEQLYRRWSMPQYGYGQQRIAKPTTADVVEALERALQRS